MMKHIIKILSLVFIINSTQIFASDDSIDMEQDQNDHSIDKDQEQNDRSIDKDQDQDDPPKDMDQEQQSDRSMDVEQVSKHHSLDMNKVQSDLKARFANAGFQDLAQFYRSRQYMPMWIDENGISRAAEHALATFTNAGGEGLDPNDYQKAIKVVNDTKNNPERATDAEIILTKTALKYIDDVNGNRLNTQNITNELFVRRPVSIASKVFGENMSADPSGAWLESYTFNNPHYQALKSLLAEYRQNHQGDDKKIQQIVINMERWRWLPEKMPQRYAIVNAATFNLKCIENDRVVLEMPVIIGTNYRKTPVFASTVDSIRFNPSWHLPRHIAIEDSLPKIKADSGYFDQRKFVLYNSAGQVISPYKVNWASVNESNFNFHLRQIPGDHNAMGKIRFGLTNSRGIYLHDTSDKEDFEKDVKTFSSGCIRLKYADQFAYFVFNDPENWPLTTIRENMEGTLTKNVPLAQQLPVFITYFTVGEGEDGKMHFADDVYNKDQQLINMLKYPLSEIPSGIELKPLNEISTEIEETTVESPFRSSVESPFRSSI